MSGPRTVGVTLALRQNPQENPQDKVEGYLNVYHMGDTTVIYIGGIETKHRIELNPQDTAILAGILTNHVVDNRNPS